MAAEPTCGLEVVALVGMLVEEDVVARNICGDPQRQIFQLRRLGAAQANLLLLGVDFLEVRKRAVRCCSVVLLITIIIISNNCVQRQ